jgi:hypothetical protein
MRKTTVPGRESQNVIQRPRPEAGPRVLTQDLEVLTRLTVAILLEAP